MIDTESVACESCTAPAPGVLDASDAASRAWPRIDIETNPFKAAFPLFTQHPDIAFLDSAATAQRPACVLEAQKHFYETMNANPLRGLYSLSVEATEAIAKVRAQIAGLIGAVDEAGKPRANEVVFTRNTSESLNIVASSFAPTVLEQGDEVAITIMEHHSNLIPWQQACRAAGAKLVYLYPTKTGELADAEIAEKIGPRTKIVACTQVSNVLGCRVPVEKLAAAAHAHGGYLVVDAAQSVPHMPVDVRELGADFLAFSAHKALGPMGVGVLWGRLELLEAMPPFLTGGEMIDSVTEQDAVWAPVPEKFEAGTQDAAGIYATGAALDYLVNQVGYDTVQAREQALVHYAMDEPHGGAALCGDHRLDLLGSPPRRHQLQRARRASARRGEHPRHAGRVHQGGSPLRPAAAHLARSREPRLLPREPRVLQRQARRGRLHRRPRNRLPHLQLGKMSQNGTGLF